MVPFECEAPVGAPPTAFQILYFTTFDCINCQYIDRLLNIDRLLAGRQQQPGTPAREKATPPGQVIYTTYLMLYF